LTDPLVQAARAAQAKAYAPYSNFRVGAALESDSGDVFVGCNVENASYGLTICAERAAVCAAVSAGARRFRRAVVVTDSDPPAAPCGACRQVLSEFNRAMVVVCATVGGAVARRNLSDLLPDSFGAAALPDRVQ
jgi:cytidine deaminase